ncbi:glycosyltransferase family 4 protein [Candidatus Dependentiae bacterium]|nr:glycosyltransferase family 4 protein [Candidatus Dependentiae bacterium]
MQQQAIVHIITKLELGGAQKVCLALASGAHAAGWHTVLITGTEGILVPTAQEQPFTTILLPTLRRELSPRFIVDDIRTIWQIRSLLRSYQQQYATVIVHTHSSKAGILGRIAATLAGVQTRVHTVHGFAIHKHQSWGQWLVYYLPELFCSWLTTQFIYVSSADKELGSRIFPARTQRAATIIRAAVPIDDFVPAIRTQPTTAFVIGTISCFKPPKNLPDMIRAFARVHQALPHARLEIVGDGELRPMLEQMIADHQLQQAVTLQGWQSTVAPFLARWDIYTMTSLWEGLPCAVVEARAAQLPVVSYATGGIPDIIADGVNGYLVPPGDWQQLASKIIALGTNAPQRQQLATTTDDLTEFTQATMIKRHLQLYEQHKRRQ